MLYCNTTSRSWDTERKITHELGEDSKMLRRKHLFIITATFLMEGNLPMSLQNLGLSWKTQHLTYSLQTATTKCKKLATKLLLGPGQRPGAES